MQQSQENSIESTLLKVALRPVIDTDHTFLEQLYWFSRIEEVEGWGIFSPEERDQFLASQFYAQKTHYDRYFLPADHNIIVWEEKPIGRIYTFDKDIAQIKLIDISLLPEYRNIGIGTKLIQDLQQKAKKLKKPIQLYVEHFNRARTLYERLGFYYIEQEGGFFRMEWDLSPSLQS